MNTQSNPTSDAASAPRLGYLVSRYPAVSHTFILREVLLLRQQGLDIHCASVNPPDRSEAEMNTEERAEYAQTYYLKKDGVLGALKAHLAGIMHRSRYLSGLRYAFSFGGWDIRQMLFGLFYWTEALMLIRWMERHQLSHLHVHFATAAANIALFVKQMATVGLSLTIHGPDEFYDVPGQHLEQKIAAADFLVCIGSFARSQLMKISPAALWQKFDVCPLGVDANEYTAKPAASADRPFTMLSVGRLTPAKGQHILIEACALLREWDRSFRLVVVGAGPDEASLKAMAHRLGLDKIVTFTGALNQAAVRDWYAQSDVFVLPSFAEGIPVVLMEAMACQVPCVTTRITGIPELIRDGVDGLLVQPSDVQALADALATLMDDPILRSELGEAGRMRVQECYDLKKNVHRLGQLFQHRLQALPC